MDTLPVEGARRTSPHGGRFSPRSASPGTLGPPPHVAAMDSLSNALELFLASLCPSRNEFSEKEALRVKLETLAQSILPGVKLKPFGSTANGLSLRNSDMDLCCLSPPSSEAPRSAADLVEALGTAIQQQTSYMVKMLPRARIPIIKLGIPPSPNSPFGMSCDIGFDNRLALQNTRLLLSYVQLDPRVRPMILFIKVWTKRRKINNPYLGTLSSYGYALLVLCFLIHVRRPPVLPNLQRCAPTQNVPVTDAIIDGHDVYFNDDVNAVKAAFAGPNKDNLGQLLIAFFYYFAKEFRYGTDVLSIRSEHGFLTKMEKGWISDNEAQVEQLGGSRDLNRLCIEDPFQTGYNVARTVTKDGLYTIRGEFMRALKALQSRSDNMLSMINEMCEERADEALVIQPPGYSTNRRRSAPSPRLFPAHAPMAMPMDGASDFRQWVEANSNVNGYTVGIGGQLLAPTGSAISESGEISPTLPSLPPSRATPHFNPRTMGYRHGPSGALYQPLRGTPRGRGAHQSPPVLERRLSWDETGHERRSYSRHPRSARIEQGGVAMTAPASPLLGAEHSRSNGPRNQPRSLSGSSTDRRHHYGSPSSYVNGITQVVGSVSPVDAFVGLSPIQFGSFGSQNENAGLGLFGSPTNGIEEDDELDGRRSASSFVGSESDVIVFGDVPVVRRSTSSVVGADEESSITGGRPSAQRSGAVSPTASLPESTTSSAAPPVVAAVATSASTSTSPPARAGARTLSPAFSAIVAGTANSRPPTLAEHLSKLDLADSSRRSTGTSSSSSSRR